MDLPDYDLHVDFPDFGGPRIAKRMGTTGLGEGWVRYVMGSAWNCSRAAADDRK